MMATQTRWPGALARKSPYASRRRLSEGESGPLPSRQALCLPPRASGFTLIELILVMALLTVLVSVAAPRLSQFFRGRTLNSEARRLLALTRGGQSRAVSEGLPMDLWVDTATRTFGLEAERSFETSDPRAVEFNLDSGLQMEVVNQTTTTTATPLNRSRRVSTASTPRAVLARANLPTIRFLPDGSIGETSPRMVRLTGADGSSLWLAQSRDGLGYEIRSTDKEDGTGVQPTGR
jgi:type II secretion system protein H